MMKKGAAFFILIIFVILASGCETFRGMGRDGKTIYKTLKEWDSEFQKVLW